MPSFIRDLFKRVLVFPGNRSGLCICRDEELLRLRLAVRCLDDGGAQAFLCEAIPLSCPIPVPLALCLCPEPWNSPAEAASGCTEDQQFIGWKLILLACHELCEESASALGAVCLPEGFWSG